MLPTTEVVIRNFLVCSPANKQEDAINEILSNRDLCGSVKSWLDQHQSMVKSSPLLQKLFGRVKELTISP